MGSVMVGAIGAARRDDADGRLLAQHGADLHARCLGAQHALGLALDLGGQIERILIGAGGMVRGCVQGRKIVPVALDVRAFGKLEAHGAENGDHFLDAAGNGVQQPVRLWRAGQGHVHALGGEAGVQRRGFKFLTTRLDHAGKLVTQAIERAATLASLIRRHAPSSLSSAVSRPDLPSVPTRTASHARRSSRRQAPEPSVPSGFRDRHS